LIALVVGAIRQLLRKEKDEASLPDRFRQDSFYAFISRFVEVKVFYLLNCQIVESLNGLTNHNSTI